MASLIRTVWRDRDSINILCVSVFEGQCFLGTVSLEFDRTLIVVRKRTWGQKNPMPRPPMPTPVHRAIDPSATSFLQNGPTRVSSAAKTVRRIVNV